MRFKFKKEPAIIVLGLGAMAGVIYWAHTMKIKELEAVAPILKRTDDLEKELKQMKDEVERLKTKNSEEAVTVDEGKVELAKKETPSKAIVPSDENGKNGYCPVWSWEPYYSYRCWLYYNYYAK